MITETNVLGPKLNFFQSSISILTRSLKTVPKETNAVDLTVVYFDYSMVE
jgi:hypothetical protein